VNLSKSTKMEQIHVNVSKLREFVPFLLKVGDFLLEVGEFVIFTHFLFQICQLHPLTFQFHPIAYVTYL